MLPPPPPLLAFRPAPALLRRRRRRGSLALRVLVVLRVVEQAEIMTAFNENCLFLFGAPRAPLAVRRASLREWGPQWGTGGAHSHQGRAALAANQSRVHPFGGYAKVYNNEVILAQFKSSPVYLTSAVDGSLLEDSIKPY